MGALYSRLAAAPAPTGVHSACSAHCALQTAALAAELTQLHGEHSEQVAELRLELRHRLGVLEASAELEANTAYAREAAATLLALQATAEGLRAEVAVEAEALAEWRRSVAEQSAQFVAVTARMEADRAASIELTPYRISPGPRLHEGQGGGIPQGLRHIHMYPTRPAAYTYVSHKACGILSSGYAVPSMSVVYNGMEAETPVHVVVSFVAHIHSKGCMLTHELIVRPLTPLKSQK